MEKVSIIIPTLNRKQVLFNTLKGLDGQSYKNFEIIIVDQSNEPIDKQSFKKLNNKINLFHIDKIGSHRARNYAVGKSEGEILLFLDDDVMINDNDFVSKHVRNYKDSQIGLITGRVVQPWENFSSPARRVAKVSKLLLRVSGSFNYNLRQMTNSASGGNLSCRRKTYLNLGGLDTGFKGTASLEDIDFSLRVVGRGWKVIFDPEPALRHLAFKKGGQRNYCKEQVDQFYWFFNNYIYLFFKHGKKIFLPLFLFYLFARGFFYIFKYKDIRIFTYSTIKGIYHGLKRKNI
jgi:glycosyltransferase involved in cell wall biosynthesis